MSLNPINKQLHFIVGIGRSGTTLLTKLLNNHPDIHCLPEANFLAFFLQKYKNKKNFTSTEVDTIFIQIKLFSLSNPWVGWELNIDKTKQIIFKWIEKNNEINYQNLCKIIYSNFEVVGFDKENANTLIDKNPSFTLFLDQINQTFTNSKFIFIVRDYRANILSRKQSVYLESANISYNSYRWNFFNKNVISFQEKNKDKVLLVRYEDLITNPDFELKKACNFLNLKDDYILTNENDQYKNLPSNISVLSKHNNRFEKKYTDLSKSINTDRLDSWRKELTTDEIKTCEAICGNFAENFGYKTIHKIDFIERKVMQFKNIKYFIKAFISVYKEQIIFYITPTIKLKRLRKVYKDLGFTE